mgnify:CR=1 FL=1
MNAAQGHGGGGGGGDAAAAPAVAVAASGGGTAAAGPPTGRDRQALTWARMSAGGSLPPPRSGAASVVVKGKLYMFGGYDGTKCFNDMDILDLEEMIQKYGKKI